MTSKRDKTSTFDFEGAELHNVDVRRVQTDADLVMSARDSQVDKLTVSDIIHGRREGKWYRAAMLILAAITAAAAVLVLFVD